MISENRVSHLAHLIRDEFNELNYVTTEKDMKLLQLIKEGIGVFVDTHKAVDKVARDNISKQKKGILEGSTEWEVLYGRFYEQEMKRKGMG